MKLYNGNNIEILTADQIRAEISKIVGQVKNCNNVLGNILYHALLQYTENNNIDLVRDTIRELEKVGDTAYVAKIRTLIKGGFGISTTRNKKTGLATCKKMKTWEFPGVRVQQEYLEKIHSGKWQALAETFRTKRASKEKDETAPVEEFTNEFKDLSVEVGNKLFLLKKACIEKGVAPSKVDSLYDRLKAIMADVDLAYEELEKAGESIAEQAKAAVAVDSANDCVGAKVTSSYKATGTYC